MGISLTLKSLLCLAALVLSAGAPPATASGGTSSSEPSASAPILDPAAEYRSGIKALQAQRFADAQRSFAQVLRVAPRDANTNYLAGLADAGLNDLKKARVHYERAVKADRDMVLAHRELAVTYAKLGERPKAEGELAVLTQLNAACAGRCAKAAELTEALAAVRAALASTPGVRP